MPTIHERLRVIKDSWQYDIWRSYYTLKGMALWRPERSCRALPLIPVGPFETIYPHSNTQVQDIGELQGHGVALYQFRRHRFVPEPSIRKLFSYHEIASVYHALLGGLVSGMLGRCAIVASPPAARITFDLDLFTVLGFG